MDPAETMMVRRKGFDHPVKILKADFDPKTDKEYIAPDPAEAKAEGKESGGEKK